MEASTTSTTTSTSTTAPKPGEHFECNFEHDLCGWTVTENVEDYKWERLTSQQCNSGDNGACPPADLSSSEEGEIGGILDG